MHTGCLCGIFSPNGSWILITCVMGVRISHMLDGLWNRDTKSTSVILIFVHVLVPRVKFSWFLLVIVLVNDLLVRVKKRNRDTSNDLEADRCP